MSTAESRLAERLDRLEQQVKLISEHLGLAFDDGTGDVPPQVVELARAGRRLEAIRLHTELMGTDIGGATSVVNAIV